MATTKSDRDFKRVKTEFLAAITCIHGLLATDCAYCRRPNWLESVIATAPGKPPWTIADVVAEFVPHRIPSIEMVERYLDEKGEPTRTEQRTMRKLVIAAGATIVGGVILYEGGKLVLRLLADIRSRGSSKPRG